MAKHVYISNGKKIVLADNPVAPPGGEGAVYKVLSGYHQSDCCVKLYHPTKLTNSRFKKVDFMIQNQPASLKTSNHIICWPLELIYDNQQKFAGFIMPLAFNSSEKLYELTTLKIRPALRPVWEKFDRSSGQSEKARLMMCVNIAIAIHAIHRVGKYTIVDYKPQNLLITPSGKISLTDIDSIQIAETGIVLHHAEVMTPEYAPPECHFLLPGTCYIPDSWDRFSLAVSFYELLFGIHPFVATAGGALAQANQIGEKIQASLFVHGSNKRMLTMIPNPHNDFNQLPQRLRSLFVLAFESGIQNPQNRPTAEDWGLTISQELEHYQPRQNILLKVTVPPIPVIAQATTTTQTTKVPIGTFNTLPTGGHITHSGSSNRGLYAVVLMVTFFGFILTCKYFTKNIGQITDARKDSTTPSKMAITNIKSAQEVRIKHRHRPVAVAAVKQAPCKTEVGDILVSNHTDHVLTLHISIYSVKKQKWEVWLEFPEIQPHTLEQAMTNAAGTRVLSANRYRYYAEYNDGGGKYSRDVPREVAKCDDNFIVDI